TELPPSWNVAPTQPISLVVATLRPEGAARHRPLTADAATHPGGRPTARAAGRGGAADAGAPAGAAVTPGEDHQGGPRRLLAAARWGLVPAWSKDPASGPLLINARSETLTAKPSFRAAAARRRAIVPANGYYEWAAAGDGPKTPFYLHPDSGGPLALAAVYEWWRAPTGVRLEGFPISDDGWLCSAAIVTRPATDTLGRIHDRMPVVVPPALLGAWLDPTPAGPDEVNGLLAAFPDPALTPRRVGRAVGSVRNNRPDLIEEAAA
ncbi:MAG: SOS response-associated peptidase, partial [Bifidobacteriaceae bacterium]|nr:SOS response-associated peptidase [Bifidobacteriaceae bacterium]